MTETNNKRIKHEKRVKEAEEKSRKFVEDLLDDCLCNEVLEKIKYISHDQYKDVVEERFILNKCGFAICKNPVNQTKKQQYTIIKNKLYDISERKMFCSNKCFESSKVLLSKVPTTALWLRETENEILLPHGVDGKPGDEIVLLPKIEHKDVKKLKKDVKKTVRFTETTSDNQIMNAVVSESFHTVKDNDTVAKTTYNTTTQANGNLLKQGQDVYKLSLDVIQKWTTLKTLEYLGFQEKNIEIKKQSNMDEMNEYRQRVEQFYKGQMSTGNEENKIVRKEIYENESDIEVLLPTVDSYAQINIRRKIVYQKLSSYASNIIPILGMHSPTLLQEIRELIATFELTSTNTMLEQHQWPIIVVILLIMLGKLNNELHRKISHTDKILNKLLQAYRITLATLYEKVEEILNVVPSA